MSGQSYAAGLHWTALHEAAYRGGADPFGAPHSSSPWALCRGGVVSDIEVDPSRRAVTQGDDRHEKNDPAHNWVFAASRLFAPDQDIALQRYWRRRAGGRFAGLGRNADQPAVGRPRSSTSAPS